MTDEVTTTSTAVAEAPDQGQPELSSESTSSPVAESTPETQTPTSDGNEKPPERRSANLQSDPNFRKYQAQTNRTIEELRKQAEEARRSLEEIQTKNMTDAQRHQYEAEKYRRMYESEAEERKRENELRMLIEAQQAQFAELHEKTGVPFELLENAKSPVEAANIAMDYQAQALRSEARQRQERQQQTIAANSSDTGKSSPPESKTDYEKAYNAAKENRDPVALARLVMQRKQE